MTTNNFLGRPINGIIHRYSQRKLSEQYTAEKFLEELDKVFENPRIVAIRWDQYTPYFNDGDACVFGIGEISVELIDEDHSKDFEDEVFIQSYELWNWDRNSNFLVANPKYADVVESLEKLSDLDHYSVILHDYFGDPAQVTATREGFEVEFYDHD